MKGLFTGLLLSFLWATLTKYTCWHLYVSMFTSKLFEAVLKERKKQTKEDTDCLILTALLWLHIISKITNVSSWTFCACPFASSPPAAFTGCCTAVAQHRSSGFSVLLLKAGSAVRAADTGWGPAASRWSSGH